MASTATRLMLEASIVTTILRHLKKVPEGFVWKTHGGPMRAGMPDILFVYGGRLYAFEVKRPGGKATARQLNTLEQLRKAGAVAEVVYSWQEVKWIMETGGTYDGC